MQTSYSQNDEKPFNNLLLEEHMKNITKRKDGRYMGRIRLNYKTYYCYASSLKECASKLAQLKKELKKNSTESIFNKNILFETWSEKWYYTFKEPFLKPKTAKDLLFYVNELNSYFGKIRLDKITAVSIQNFLNGYETSRKKEILTTYLNAIFQKAIDLTILKGVNPCRLIVKDKKLNNIRPPFTKEEQYKIVEAIKGTKLYAPIMLYLFTGIRKNEYTPDIAKEIVNHTLKVQSEKKRTVKPVYRYIDLTPEAEEFIVRHKKDFKISTDNIYKQFNQLLKSIGIVGKSLHNLRHTFASNHYALKTPTKQISAWLGHATVEITQNIYIHIDKTMSAEDVNKLYNNLYYRI